MNWEKAPGAFAAENIFTLLLMAQVLYCAWFMTMAADSLTDEVYSLYWAYLVAGYASLMFITLARSVLRIDWKDVDSKIWIVHWILEWVDVVNTCFITLEVGGTDASCTSASWNCVTFYFYVMLAANLALFVIFQNFWGRTEWILIHVGIFDAITDGPLLALMLLGDTGYQGTYYNFILAWQAILLFKSLVWNPIEVGVDWCQKKRRSMF